MTEPQEFTAQQASDPMTPAQTLADIAAQRPDLRPAVAANPSTYPGLLEWLGGLGDPQVDAALAARSAAPVAEQPPAGWQQAPEQAPPVQGYPGQPAPGQPYPGQPYPGQPAPGQPYPGQPGQPYAGTPPKKSNGGKIALIVVGIILVLVVGAVIAAVFLFRSVADNVTDQLSSLPGISESGFDDGTGETSDPGDGGVPGTDPDLDALWMQCDEGDMGACDQLFLDSPFGSDYENFGDTCGGRQEAGTGNFCVDLN